MLISTKLTVLVQHPATVTRKTPKHEQSCWTLTQFSLSSMCQSHTLEATSRPINAYHSATFQLWRFIRKTGAFSVTLGPSLPPFLTPGGKLLAHSSSPSPFLSLPLLPKRSQLGWWPHRASPVLPALCCVLPQCSLAQEHTADSTKLLHWPSRDQAELPLFGLHAWPHLRRDHLTMRGPSWQSTGVLSTNRLC